MSYEELEKLAKFSCPKCKSVKLVIFESKNVYGIISTACFNCMDFMIYSKDKDQASKDVSLLEQN